MFDKPIIIIGAPRSGTTILTRCIALHPSIWHLPAESHSILEGPLHPKYNNYKSNRCIVDSKTDAALLNELKIHFYQKSINLNSFFADPTFLMAPKTLFGRVGGKLITNLVGHLSSASRPKSIRFLEKTPKNTLRIPLLNHLFPDALFIFNQRVAETNIDSLISGWHAVDKFLHIEQQRFARSGYPITKQLKLKDYSGEKWKFTLVPDWKKLQGRSVSDVAAWQYFQCNRIAIEDLKSIPKERVFWLKHEEFVQSPQNMLHRIFKWADLPDSRIPMSFAGKLPRVNAVNGDRKAGLRYPVQVQGAIERIPELMQLNDEMMSIVH